MEKVYENALRVSLTKAGLAVDQQRPIAVEFEGEKVGDYFADLIVGDSVIAEVKAAEAIAPDHEAQLINYLKATEYQVGLLLNLVPTPNSTARFSPINQNPRPSAKSAFLRVLFPLAPLASKRPANHNGLFVSGC